MTEGHDSLTDLVDRIEDMTDEDQISLDRLIDAVGRASFTPVLLIPAIAVATPLSGIPLFSSAMGVLIFLVAVQMVSQRDHLWFPQWLLNRHADSERVKSAFHRVRPVMKWLDAKSHKRLSFLVRQPIILIPQLLCAATGMVMPFLEFVPFSSSLAGIAVSILAFGMLTRDGLFVLLGFVPYVGLAWLIARVV